MDVIGILQEIKLRPEQLLDIVEDFVLNAGYEADMTITDLKEENNNTYLDVIDAGIFAFGFDYGSTIEEILEVLRMEIKALDIVLDKLHTI